MKLPYARNRVDLPAGRDRASDPPLSCSTLVLQLIHPRVNRSATEASTMSNSGVLDTRFRSALERMAVQGRLNAYTAPIDPHLKVAAVMKKLDEEHPGYGFSQHKGYPVKAHVAALTRLGASPVHRRSFGPVRVVLGLPPLAELRAAAALKSS
jgi:hypothetical protein